MSKKKELNGEQLNKVSGGYSPTQHPAGYWYGVYGTSGRYRYRDEKFGYSTEQDRDNALASAIEHAQQMGVTSITSEKGYY